MNEDIGDKEAGDERREQGPGTETEAVPLEPLERVDPPRSRGVGRDRELDAQRFHVREEERAARAGVGEHAPPAGIVARPDPPRHLEPRPVGRVVGAHRQIGHRPAVAADPPDAAVFGESGIVGLVELPGARQEPADEDEHRRQPHQLADRQFECLQTEAGLDEMAGLGQRDTESPGFRRALHHQRPPAPQDRRRLEREEEVAAAVAEGGERLVVEDPPLLPGHVGARAIEGNLHKLCLLGRPHRDSDPRVVAAVGVDDQIHRGAADPAGVGVEGGVLQPHARVKELRLVPPHDDRARDPVGDVTRPFDVAVAAGVFGGHREHLTPCRGHQFPQPHVTDARVEGGPQEAVVVEERLDGVGRRVGLRHEWRMDQPVAGEGRGSIPPGRGGPR